MPIAAANQVVSVNMAREIRRMIAALNSAHAGNLRRIMSAKAALGTCPDRIVSREVVEHGNFSEEMRSR